MRQSRPDTEEDALKIGVPFLIAGVVTGLGAWAADNSWGNPWLYVTGLMFALGLYLVLGAYIRVLPLPLRPSDKRAGTVRTETDSLIERAHELRGRQTRTEEAQRQFISDYRTWTQDAYDALVRMGFEHDAESLGHHEGESIGDSPRFNDEDLELRRRLKWQTQIVRGVRNRVP